MLLPFLFNFSIDFVVFKVTKNTVPRCPRNKVKRSKRLGITALHKP